MHTFDFAFVGSLVPLLPLLGISIAGALLCRSRLLQSHPRACSLATIGWAVVALRTGIGQGVSSYLAIYGAQIASEVTIARALTITTILSYFLLIAALVLFMLAILADRGSREESIRAA